MTFISYSQNFEDVLLFRALKNIENGFYIDIGANDPVIDSITKAFYDRGWSGINCEPLVSHYEDLKKARPRDINLNYAVGDSEGVFQIWESDVRGWATLSEDIRSAHEALGMKLKSHQVSQTTLTKICSEHLQNQDQIHFLKIDVEGLEEQVLKGFNLNMYRPWILVIEAIDPITQVPNFVNWESMVLQAAYHYVYTDGLNRFYISKEREYLAEFFKYPVNVLDEFAPAAQVAADVRVKEQDHELKDFENRIFDLENQIALIQKDLQESKNEIQAIFESNSWRVTRPLRFLSRLIGGKNE